MITPDESEVRAQLARLLASDTLSDAQRAGRLLRFVVEETLAGRAAQLKEFTLGADALERGPHFDPRVDPIARVEASRLRTRLETYYATTGASDPVVISLPKGGYVPQFARRAPPAERPRAFAEPPPIPAPVDRRRLFFPLLVGGIAGALGGGAAVLAWRRPRNTDPGREVPRASLRIDVHSGAEGSIVSNVGLSMALTRDGRVLVFVAARPDGTSMLFARDLNSPGARELPGTLGARHPFVSPDGRWVAFLGDGKLRKVQLDGRSAVIDIASAPDLQGGSWGRSGIVATVSAQRNVLAHFDPDTGDSRILLEETPPLMAAWPQYLDHGAILFSGSDALGRGRLEVIAPDRGLRRVVIEGASYGRYLASGHLAYVIAGNLFTVPFDLATLQTTGQATQVIEGVAFSPTFGMAQFDASDEGTLVYRRETPTVLTWINPDGTTRSLQHTPGSYVWPRISPDGRRVAYTNEESGTFDLWVQDIASGERQRISRGAVEVGHPTWTPEGQYILYGGRGGIHWSRTDQSRIDQPLGGPDRLAMPGGYHAGNGRLVFWTMDPRSGFDVWTLPMKISVDGLTSGSAEPFFQGRGFDVFPQFSPNGRWIAYASDESGTSQIYVRAYPDNGRLVQVSSRFGRVPKWSGSGSHLYFIDGDRRILQVECSERGGVFSATAPRPWSPLRLADVTVTTSYDIDPQGRGAVALLPATPAGERDDHFTFVTNFFEEIRRSEYQAVKP